MESAARSAQAKQRIIRFRPSMPVTLGLIALAVAVLLTLGTWQLLRERDTQRAESERNESVAAAPIPWRADPPITTEEVDFHRVTVSGRWDNEHTMILANRVRYDTKGEEVVTPLIPDGGGPAILVNRGWYPLEERDRILAELTAQTVATVEGLGRAAPRPEGASVAITGTTAGRTPEGAWAWFDIPSMAAELPYPVVPWQLIQGVRDTGAGRPSSLPVQTWGTEVSTSPHLEYALTWYGLAAALVVIAIVRLRTESRLS